MLLRNIRESKINKFIIITLQLIISATHLFANVECIYNYTSIHVCSRFAYQRDVVISKMRFDIDVKFFSLFVYLVLCKNKTNY
jgi:hypothetical protein